MEIPVLAIVCGCTSMGLGLCFLFGVVDKLERMFMRRKVAE